MICNNCNAGMNPGDADMLAIPAWPAGPVAGPAQRAGPAHAMPGSPAFKYAGAAGIYASIEMIARFLKAFIF